MKVSVSTLPCLSSASHGILMILVQHFYDFRRKHFHKSKTIRESIIHFDKFSPVAKIIIKEGEGKEKCFGDEAVAQRRKSHKNFCVMSEWL